jgi:hypothetical protein
MNFWTKYASLAVVLALPLTGAMCSTTQDRIVVKDVNVPVALACKPDVGAKPDFPDTPAAILNAPNVRERARLYAAGRPLHWNWEARLETALASCANAPLQPTPALPNS